MAKPKPCREEHGKTQEEDGQGFDKQEAIEGEKECVRVSHRHRHSCKDTDTGTLTHSHALTHNGGGNCKHHVRTASQAGTGMMRSSTRAVGARAAKRVIAAITQPEAPMLPGSRA